MRLLLPLFCLAVLLSACMSHSGQTDLQDIALISPSNQVVSVLVEVADSPELWVKGLSNRAEPLESNEGMLFVFPQRELRSFWMKDTHFPLDILFFDNAGKVSHITQMTPCTEDPCSQYSSEKPSSIALEVPAGFVKQYGIEVGWQLALPTQN